MPNGFEIAKNRVRLENLAKLRAIGTPANCIDCVELRDAGRSCRVLTVLVENCFVRRQAEANRARGITAMGNKEAA